MGALLVPVILVVVVLIVGALLAVRFSRRERALADSIGEDVPALRYHVPEGQDVAALVAALRNQGYEAATDHASGGRELLVSCPGGADAAQRGRVRAVIEHAALNMERDRADAGPVRFIDE